MPNPLSMTQIQPMDIAPAANMLANIPNQVRQNQKMNLLQQQVGMQAQKQRWTIEQADRETQMKAMDWLGRASFAAGDDPANLQRLKDSASQRFGVDVDDDDIRSAMDYIKGSIGLQNAGKNTMTAYQKAQIDLGKDRNSIARSKAAKSNPLKTTTDNEGFRYYVDPETGRAGDRVFPDASGLNPTFRAKANAGLASGLSEEQSFQFASGLIAPQIDPVTRQKQFVNLLTGDIVQPSGRSPNSSNAPLPPEGQLIPAGAGDAQFDQFSQAPQQGQQEILPPAPSGEPESLYRRADKITGAKNTIGEAVSGVTEQVGIQVASDAVQQSISDFDVAQNKLVRTFTLNPRFPQGEVNRVLKLMDRGIVRSAGQLRKRMIALDKAIAGDIPTLRSIAADDTKPVEMRKEAAARLVAAMQFKETLGVPRLVKNPNNLKQLIDQGVLQTGDHFRLPNGKIRLVN